MYTESPYSSNQTLEALRDRARDLVLHGELHKALALLDEALAVASRSGDTALHDLTVCNRSAVAIALGQHGDAIPSLREILMRTDCHRTAFLAADNLSRAHERDKAFKKGLFYARTAQDHASIVDNAEWLASCHIQMGNCLLGDSYFADARREYESALALVGDEKLALARLITVANLGYCLMMLGDLRRGMGLSYDALRGYRRLGAEIFETTPLLDLCFAHLELGRLDTARRHGRRALRLAEADGHDEHFKVALFLLGETERAANNPLAAHGYFSQLQRDFYPDQPQIIAMMTAIEMRQMVNLRA
ncbi:MAG: hypothetical protein AAGD38_11435 [Acidobacteriota bacterium]